MLSNNLGAGTGDTALEHAIFHAKQGKKIFRLKTNSKEPAESGWQQKATSDEQTVKAMFNKHPDSNYGILTGPDNGLVVLDIDEKNDVSGSASIIKHISDADLDTYTVSTPSDGRHCYYVSFDPSLKNRTAMLPGVDFRGRGGYIVGPGSKINGKAYKVITDKPVMQLPQSIVQLIAQKKVVQLAAQSPLAGVNQGGRDDAIFKYARSLLKVGLSHPEAATLVLTKAGNCIPPFPEEQALKCLNSAWNYKADNILSPKAVDGAALLAMEIPEPEWVVESILPVGLGLLAGKPKAGKSWMSLSLAVRVASGGYLFDTHPVSSGVVTVLALEDTRHRLKSRLLDLGATGLSAGGLQIFTEWPRSNTDLLEEHLESRTGTKLVIVDTHAKFRHSAKSNADLYGKDYEDISKLKKVADKYSIAILVLHHLRKAKSDDPFEMINGTGGITGAADTLWVLDRAPSAPTANLFVRGRDVEDQTLSLQFEGCHWTQIGEFEYKPNATELKYLSLLKTGPLSPKQLAESVQDEVQVVTKRLQRMVEKGMITKVGHGVYSCLGVVL